MSNCLTGRTDALNQIDMFWKAELKLEQTKDKSKNKSKQSHKNCEIVRICLCSQNLSNCRWLFFKVRVQSTVHIKISYGAVHKLCRLKGEGQKLPIKRRLRGRKGEGQKLLILRRHSFWPMYGVIGIFWPEISLSLYANTTGVKSSKMVINIVLNPPSLKLPLNVNSKSSTTIRQFYRFLW